jgi:hypothetical protein
MCPQLRDDGREQAEQQRLAAQLEACRMGHGLAGLLDTGLTPTGMFLGAGVPI